MEPLPTMDTNTKQLNTALASDLSEMLKKEARQQGCTIRRTLEGILKEYFKARVEGM